MHLYMTQTGHNLNGTCMFHTCSEKITHVNLWHVSKYLFVIWIYCLSTSTNIQRPCLVLLQVFRYIHDWICHKGSYMHSFETHFSSPFESYINRPTAHVYFLKPVLYPIPPSHRIMYLLVTLPPPSIEAQYKE